MCMASPAAEGRAALADQAPVSAVGHLDVEWKRALAATRKRHAHLLANAEGTELQNEARNPFQNGEHDDDHAVA